MKRSISFLAGATSIMVLAGGLIFAYTNYPAAEENPVLTITLAQGGEAWLWPAQQTGVAALTILFDGGGRLDPPGKEGLGSMVAGLLDAGAGPLDAVAFQTRLAENAIRLDFGISRDRLAVNMQFLPEAADEAFWLLGLALTAPRFAENGQQRVRGQLLSALAAQAQNPNALAWEGWKNMAFGDHVYARHPNGSAESLEAITSADIKAQHHRLLTGPRFIAAAGAIAPEKVRQHLNRLFASLPAQDPSPALPALAFAPAQREHAVHAQEQQLTYFGLPGLRREAADFIPASIMTHILGGNSISRLSRAVRDEAGLTYNISLSLIPWKLGGVLIGQSATKAERAGELLELVRREFARMAQEGVEEDELAAAKAHLIGAYPLRFDSSAQIAAQLAAIAYYGLGADYVSRRNALIEAATPEQIHHAARRLLREEDLLIFTLGPSLDSSLEPRTEE